jgi:hypothetical protein
MDAQKKFHRLSLGSILAVLALLFIGFSPPPIAAQVFEVKEDPRAVQAAPAPTPGRVRGRVTYADTGRPVRHAGIYLEALSEIESEEDENPEPEIPNTVADMNGEFFFPKVPPGRYAVYPNDGGLVLLSNYPDADASFEERIRKGSLTAGFAVITVSEGRETKVELTGERSAAIAGRVLYADGATVGNAFVLVFRRGKDEKLSLVTSGQSDSRGVYRISNLPGGEYVVAARDREVETNAVQDEKQAYSSGLLVNAYHPAARDSRKAEPVQVPAGGDAENIDVTLPDLQMFAIGGQVTLKTKASPPLTRAQVTLTQLENEPGQPPRPSPLALMQRNQSKYTAYTDGNGAWTISGVPPGVYNLTFDGSEARLPQPPNAPQEAAGKSAGALTMTQEIVVKDGDINDLQTALPKGGSLRVALIAEKGFKLPEYISIHARRVDDTDEEFNGDAGSCYASAEEPDCEIDGLPSGSYLLEAYNPVDEDDKPAPPIYIKSLTHKNLDITKTPLKVSVGQTISGLRVTLSDKFAAVSGKALLDAKSKKPAVGKIVVFMPVEAARRRLSPDTNFMKIEADGNFAFGQVEPGDYFLFVSEPKVKFDEEFWRKNADKLPRVTLKAGVKLENQEVFAP